MGGGNMRDFDHEDACDEDRRQQERSKSGEKGLTRVASCDAIHPTDTTAKPCHKVRDHSFEHRAYSTRDLNTIVTWEDAKLADPVPLVFTPGMVVTGYLIRGETDPSGSTLQIITKEGHQVTVRIVPHG